MDEENDDDWLETRTVHCHNCGHNLMLCEHSPFENGYYFYCDRCPRRVEVSFYDTEFGVIERELVALGIPMDSDAWLPKLLPAISNRLAPCRCGGTYLDDAPRRCLYCASVIPGAGDLNVWFTNSFDDDAPHNLHEDVIGEPVWKPQRPCATEQ